jgi:hypothetical protein
MSHIGVDYNVLNQNGSPAWFSDTYANIPTAGYLGRMFISTDTFAFYRDTGSGWDLIGGPGTGTITGSGVSGQIPYFNGSSTIAGTNNLFWDITNNYLGINTNTPGTNLDIHGTNGNLLQLNNITTANSYIAFQNQGTSKWRIGNNNFSSANSFDIFNVTSSSSIISINSTNNIGIGGSYITGYTINVAKNITGATTSYGIRSQGTVQSDVTTSVTNYGSLLNTAVSSFTLTEFVHYRSVQGTIGSGSVVTSQYGYYADSSMTGATNNFGFYGGIASGTNRWNLYMAGTAFNYFAGNIVLGTTSQGSNINLRIAKAIAGSSSLSYGMIIDGTVASGVTGEAQYYSSTSSTNAAVFTLSRLIHYQAYQGTFGAGSTVTNQYGFYVASTLTGATSNFGFYSDIPASANNFNLYCNGTANNLMNGALGIGTSSLTGVNLNIGKTLTGAVNSIVVSALSTIQSDVSGSAVYFQAQPNTVASLTMGSLTYFKASGKVFGAGTTITNQYGFYAESDIIGATNNYGFYGNIASATGRFNLYMNGTATNFLQGELTLGTGQVVSASVTNTVTNKVKLIINGTTYYLLASTSGT